MKRYSLEADYTYEPMNGSMYQYEDGEWVEYNEVQSHLRLLAAAVLEAHLGQIFTNNEDGNNNTQRLQIRACQCEACKVAREVMR